LCKELIQFITATPQRILRAKELTCEGIYRTVSDRQTPLVWHGCFPSGRDIQPGVLP